MPRTAARRVRLVRQAAARYKGLVWDLGCNDGTYSRVAAEHADTVVAVDADHATVDGLYRALREEQRTDILPLVMSLIASAGGVGLYLLVRGPIESGRILRTPILGLLDGQRLFQGVLAGLTAAARWGQRRLGTRRLQSQMLLLVLATVAAIAVPLWLGSRGAVSWRGTHPPLAFSPMFALLWMVGCGAAIGFVAGVHRRAPLWMQRTGLEWLHRLASEPARLMRRYLVHDVPFALQLLAVSVRERLRRSRAVATAP